MRGRRNQPQPEVFGIHPGAGHDRSGELFVLVVGGADVSALGPAQRIFSGAEVTEFKAPIVAGNHEDQAFGVPDLLQRNASPGEGIAFTGADNSPGNPVRAGDGRSRRLRHERRGHGEKQ